MISAALSRQAIDWGLTGDQLVDAVERHGYLAVHRPQLTWRVIGFAEALGLQIGQLHAVTDTRRKACKFSGAVRRRQACEPGAKLSDCSNCLAERRTIL
jgi:hypothetical protein